MCTLGRTCVLLVLVTISVGGCANSRRGGGPGGDAGDASGPAPVLISVVSDMDSNPQAVDMALRFAGFALDEKRSVFLFFNVKGVNVPVQGLADDAAFESAEPIKRQLASLVDRGAKLHVCPVCMKALHVEKGDLIPGAEVTNRAALFAAIERGTCVFTY